MTPSETSLALPGEHILSWCAAPLYLSPIAVLLLSWLLVRRETRMCSPGKARDISDGVKDEDVLAEEARVDELVKASAEATQAAVVHGLQHTYRTKIEGNWTENHAVRGISYSVQSGECFGILGPN